MRLCRGVLACWLLQWLAGGAAMAVRLPLHRLTSADGLAHDQVRSIVMDVRGFLWFGTLDGLSRYDGKSFRTYGKQNGQLGISLNTVRDHVRSIYHRLHVHTRSEAVSKAIRRGILS